MSVCVCLCVSPPSLLTCLKTVTRVSNRVALCVILIQTPCTRLACTSQKVSISQYNECVEGKSREKSSKDPRVTRDRLP